MIRTHRHICEARHLSVSSRKVTHTFCGRRRLVPSRHLILTLLLSLLALGVVELRAQGTWAVAASSPLDDRITRQLDGLARGRRARVRYFPSAAEAAQHRAKLLIELDQQDLDPFFQDLKQRAGAAGTELTPELAREGYRLSATYARRSAPQRIQVTAATAEGFHHALLRVPELLANTAVAAVTVHARGGDAASKISKVLTPPAQFVDVTQSGTTIQVTLADFPSFPERGIVEGFYGVPWRHEDRLEILRFEGQHGMNVYYYAPKDDPYHRKLWREPYPPREAKQLSELISTAKQNFVQFCFAISPGLSMTYSSEEDFSRLTSKLESVGKLGVSCFALFLDDVPQELENPEDRAKFKTLAEAHVYLINQLEHYLKSQSPANRLVVTPTTYAGEWGSRDYIRELGAGVTGDVALVWTGPKVVSPALTAAQAKEWGELLHRPPLMWDNFPVNDGINWRLNLGPLRGREANLPTAVAGLISNPMNQAHASMIPLQTVADYLWNAAAYDPRASLQRALDEQYGVAASRLLAPFLKTYGDYWWDENVLKPLFVEEHKAIDTREIERRLHGLDSSLRRVHNLRSYRMLRRELSPFPRRTRQRLAAVRESPAFRRLPGHKLQWRDDHDVLSAQHLVTPPPLDGDFAKWSTGPHYVLDKAKQISGGARLWRGPSQFSVRLALGWDDDALYVGVDATDRDLYQPFSGRGIQKGDAIILILETAFRKNFENTQTDGDEYRLLFSPGNFAGVEPSVFSDEDYLPPRPQPRDYNREIKTAWKKTATGFSGDIAIPASWFDGGKFQAGYEIGLSFGAQKVPEKSGGEGEVERIDFTSKSDRLFPTRLSNPSSYQRLVLAGSS